MRKVKVPESRGDANEVCRPAFVGEVVDGCDLPSRVRVVAPNGVVWDVRTEECQEVEE